MLFVREFRPLSRHSFSSHLFHLAQRKDYMMVETRPVGLLLWFLGCVLWSLFFSPPSDCFSLPSTMTWAPCPHGVRTRGKKYMLTRVPSALLSNYYCHGYPFTPKMEDRPFNQYGPLLYSEGRWDQLCAWLTGNSKFRSQLAGHKQALRDQMGHSQEASDPSNKARRTVPPPGAGSSSSAAGSSCHIRPPPPPPPYGWWQ